jgi:proteasome accessory factor C
VDVLEASFEAPTDRPANTTDVYHPRSDDPRVVLDLDPPAHWIAEQYPNEGVDSLPDSVLRVTLRTSQRAWLERLLLRAGPSVRLVEGDRQVAPEAARRILARYRGSQTA